MMRSATRASRAAATWSSVPKHIRHASSRAFLQDVSSLPTMFYQSSLPRLPIPKLEETMSKYLKSASAVVPAEQMEETTKVAKEFEQGIGAELHAELVKHDNAHKETSFISGPWFDMYLKNRDAFPLNLSPQLTWKDDADAAKMDQAARAANILAAAARFCNSLRANVLVPDVFHTKKDVYDGTLAQMAVRFVPNRFAFYAAAAAGSYALDMSQYAGLFSSTRVPKKGKDVIVTAKHDPTFVVVQRGARFYKVHVMDPATGPLGEEAIEAQLRAVLADTSKGDEPPVGVLSAIDRDWAAELRPELEALNQATMADVDSALFCLTLDDTAPTEAGDVSRLMLHGDGRNRWFEKSFHVVVAANGKAGVNWEHSWGDGVAMLRFFEEVYKEISATPARAPVAPASSVSQLTWTLTPHLRAEISRAEDATDAFFASAELCILESDALTKGDLKKQKLSPDGTMQMVMQLAHNTMFGYTPATYESGSTAAFKHGRTETIRSATPESNAMVAAFQNPDATATERLAALRTAVDNHSTLTREAVTGKGFDRHLFGLRTMAAMRGRDDPALYSDPTFATMSDIRLSTSTLSSAALDGGGFGPISPRAFSVGYGIVDIGSRFAVMTNGLGTQEFTEHLAAAMAAFKDTIYSADE